MGKLSLKNKKSFTVVEILIVGVIMGIFLVFSIPQFNKIYHRFRFNSLTDNVVSFLRMSQEKAVTLKSPLLLRIFPKENKLELQFQKQILKVLKIPPEIKIETDMSKCKFEPFGGIEIFDNSIKDGKLPAGSLVPSGYILLNHLRENRESKVMLFTTGYIKIQ